MNVRVQPNIPLLELDHLRTLVAIAETGSFSGAAAAVYRTPSAISMQVKKVEDLLGRALFVRDSRSVSLTADGEFLLEHARRMLAQNREAMALFVAPDLKGVVRLGSTELVVAAPTATLGATASRGDRRVAGEGGRARRVADGYDPRSTRSLSSGAATPDQCYLGREGQ